MALRLVTAIAGEQARRPLAFAFFLLLGAAVLVGPALAEDANEAFSATVKVDATADSAAAAREVARIDGQRRALAAVIEHLSGSSETKPPKLDDKAITDMVDSFEVTNERMSAVRYIADYTFHFRPSKVNALVSLDFHDRIAVVTISNPPVNALSPGVPEGIHSSIESAAAGPGRRQRPRGEQQEHRGQRRQDRSRGWQQADGGAARIQGRCEPFPVGRPQRVACGLGAATFGFRTRPFDPSAG